MSELKRERWGSQWAFVLVAGGAAAGLGNIWKFPYVAAENGGGAFVLVYLVCILAVGLPVLMAEFVLGRVANKNNLDGIRDIVKASDAAPAWVGIGWMGMAALLVVLSIYSVVGGWALAYFFGALSDLIFPNVNSVSEPGASFAQLTSNPMKSLGWYTLFMVSTIAIVAGGVSKGIQRVSLVLMPMLLLLLAILIVFGAVTTDKMQEALSFLLFPDFHKLSAAAVLEALGHAFFTLSVGVGAMIAFGSYLPARVNLMKASLAVVGLDTLVALLASLAIFPVMLANGIASDTGPGLVFVTLPIAFQQMPWGQVLGILFFLLLSCAALTSSPSMLEPIANSLQEKTTLGRKKGTVLAGGVIWVIGVLQLLSLSGEGIASIAGQPLFELSGYLVSNLMLPAGALLIALFVGWAVPHSLLKSKRGIENPVSFRLWVTCLRYVAPFGILLILLSGL